MNIEKAKEQIKNAAIAYFTKNSVGEYIIPIERQRPIFLVGPPGIGKTAVMEQIAEELNVGLVAYSMTHHTRQSAIGLPFITKKVYNGKEYSVSEYTMSEIIASIYEYIERTGKKEGILFLDEINCVSETLAPAMLQFLQYKIFGNHSIPEGWIVVTAGNPPEYNKSVHDFDMVTWDRLKRIEVEADFDIWKKYAKAKHMHPSVIAFLEAKPENFYRVRSTVNGKELITARGWEDISQMLQLYEKNGLQVDEDLIKQYIHCHGVAQDFSNYYTLFSGYRDKFSTDNVLKGNITPAMLSKAQKASIDEGVAISSILIDDTLSATTSFFDKCNGMAYYAECSKNILTAMKDNPSCNVKKLIDDNIADTEKLLTEAQTAQKPISEIHVYKQGLKLLNELSQKIMGKSTTVAHADRHIVLADCLRTSAETDTSEFAKSYEALVARITGDLNKVNEAEPSYDWDAFLPIYIKKCSQTQTPMAEYAVKRLGEVQEQYLAAAYTSGDASSELMAYNRALQEGLSKDSETLKAVVDNIYTYLEQAFPNNGELLTLLTETISETPQLRRICDQDKNCKYGEYAASLDMHAKDNDTDEVIMALSTGLFD